MVRQILQHHLNALHVMVLFIRAGVPRPAARAMARWWERLLHRFLYPPVGALVPVPVPAPVRLQLRYRRLYR